MRLKLFPLHYLVPRLTHHTPKKVRVQVPCSRHATIFDVDNKEHRRPCASNPLSKMAAVCRRACPCQPITPHGAGGRTAAALHHVANVGEVTLTTSKGARVSIKIVAIEGATVTFEYEFEGVRKTVTRPPSCDFSGALSQTGVTSCCFGRLG